MSSVQNAIETITRLHASLGKVIRGRADTIQLVLTGLLADGHVLLEDYPGSGKTTLAKTLGRSIDCSVGHEVPDYIVPFRRIQFTPDLLPSDVLGVNIFEPANGTFSFRYGPIFSHIVLADELNRTGPKVQAAFLECMAERQVTIDNHTYPLDKLFFVIGTQNPLDVVGTYPLPLVQLDRFLLRIPMRYVDAATELGILQDADQIHDAVEHVRPVITRAELLAARASLNQIKIPERILKSIVNIVQSTRENPILQFGASTRAAIMFRRVLSAYAVVNGREHVIEDDVKYLAPFVLLHRLKFSAGTGKPEQLFSEIVMPHIEELIRAGV